MRPLVGLLCLLALCGWATDRLQFKAQGDSVGVGSIRVQARTYVRSTRLFTMVRKVAVPVRTSVVRIRRTRAYSLLRVGRGTWAPSRTEEAPHQRGPPAV